MADDLTLGLYRLIKADLENVGRYAELKPFAKRVIVSPILTPAFEKAPYLVVTPGTETGDEGRGEIRDVEIVVWVCTSILRDAYSQPELLGQVAGTDTGTLIRGVRRALARPHPYKSAAPFGASPYPAVAQTARDAILSCHYMETGPYEVLPEPKNDPDSEEIEEDMHLARPVTFRYETVEVA